MNELPGDPALPPSVLASDIESPDQVCRECGRILKGDDPEEMCARCYEENISVELQIKEQTQ